MLKYFHTPWQDIDTCWLDTETTGLVPGKDKAVSVALVRFQGGVPVGSFETLLDPGRLIPAAATDIHGITDEMCVGKPRIGDVFDMGEVKALLNDAQIGAYNFPYDRNFIPPFGDDWTWPGLDCLSLVRKLDQYVSGKGRHKLEATCKRHGVPLDNAHSAIGDATAAGMLFYKLASKMFPAGYTLGQALGWQRRIEAVEWFRFNSWLASQPERDKNETR